MKIFERLWNLIIACFSLIVAIYIFDFFDNKFIKYPFSIFFLIATIGAIIKTFSKNPSFDDEENLDEQEPPNFEDLNETDKEIVREELSKTLKRGFTNLSNKRFDLIIECQKCYHNEKFGFMNQNSNSELYSTNEEEIYYKENNKYPLLCFKCNHVTYYSPNGTSIELDNTTSYFEVIKLNQNIKKDFIEFAEENKHFDKVEKINSISV